MSDTGIEREIEEISRLIEDRLGIRAHSLEAQLRKAGRLLPSAVQREARFLAQAQLLMQNPKLARMIDPARREQAFRLVTGHLKAIDPRARRADRRLHVAAAIALNLLVAAALVIVVLRWRGIV